MSSKISLIPLATEVTGNEKIPASHLNANVTLTVDMITSRVNRQSLSIDNVDNTSDANKPVSIAVAGALSQKAPISHNHATTEVVGLAAFVNDIISNMTIPAPTAVEIGQVEW